MDAILTTSLWVSLCVCGGVGCVGARVWRCACVHVCVCVCVCRPQKYPDEVGGNIPNNVPIMYSVPGKMGGNGGKWGEMREKWEEMGGNGVLWGEVGANNKKCGARVNWFGFPIFTHFYPFFLGSFRQCTPP